MSVLGPIAVKVEQRAPGLARGVKRSAWKAKNLRRSIGFKPQTELVDQELLTELRENGIAIREFDQVFSDRATLEELQEKATHPETVASSEAKDFLQKLMPLSLDLGSPYIRLALEPRVVALANAYLGMHSYLRALDVWRNLPTDAPPKLSQLWHRDYDDLINLKLFVYLSDVGPSSGPFVFAPGTQPGGPRKIEEWHRLSDEDMEKVIPSSDWLVCTGKPGTVVLADTCGYHKGGKPTEGDRLLWTAQFTSVAPNYERNFTLSGDASGLSEEQRQAAFLR
jgi:hypothetical protein